jgi:hypothetical protein
MEMDGFVGYLNNALSFMGMKMQVNLAVKATLMPMLRAYSMTSWSEEIMAG